MVLSVRPAHADKEKSTGDAPPLISYSSEGALEDTH